MKLCLSCQTPFAAADWRCPSCGWQPRQIGPYTAFAPELASQCSGFQPDYFASLAQLEARNFWFTSRNRLITWALAKHFAPFQSCLEIGCGTGFVLSGMAAAFPGRTYAGSEVYCEGLAFAQQRLPAGTELFQMDARAIPYLAHWDLIAACDVLEHIEDDRLALRQIHQALRPGGGLILTVPQHQWLWSAQDELACHVRRYTRQEMLEKLQAAGFEVLDSRSFVSMLLPIMWLSRKRLKDEASPVDPMNELRLPGWLNTALSATMRIELALIGAGLRFPVGGSLLVCARKR